MLDQIEQMLLQIAEARRIHGTDERDGTIDQVWRQGGEQKVRVNMGQRPDGSPWLSPWLKVEDHHGTNRVQRKFHKGMNVKVSTVHGDYRTATVTPHGENQQHPEPDNADDYHETEQYARHHRRLGPDFDEAWLSSQQAQTSSQSAEGGLGIPGIGGPTFDFSDPDKLALVLARMGQKPQQQQSQGPWDGPPPDGGSPQKRYTIYAGAAGNAPQVNGDVIIHQFDKDVKTEWTAQQLLHKVQSADGAEMPSPDSDGGNAALTTIDKMLSGLILHRIQTLGATFTTMDQMENGTILHQIKTLGGIVTSALHNNGIIVHTIQDLNGNVSTFVQQARQIIHMLQGQSGFSLIAQDSQQIMGQVGNSALQILPEMINLVAGQINLNTMGIATFNSPPSIPEVNESTGSSPLLLPIPIFATLAADVELTVYASGPWYISAGFSIGAELTA